jgi:hypothetical protein
MPSRKSTVSSSANLQVTAGSTVQILATDATSSFDFDVKFVNGGVKFIGANGTTFNGVQSLFIANATSISGQLGNGDDHVRSPRLDAHAHQGRAVLEQHHERRRILASAHRLPVAEFALRAFH